MIKWTFMLSRSSFCAPHFSECTRFMSLDVPAAREFLVIMSMDKRKHIRAREKSIIHSPLVSFLSILRAQSIVADTIFHFFALIDSATRNIMQRGALEMTRFQGSVRDFNRFFGFNARKAIKTLLANSFRLENSLQSQPCPENVQKISRTP